MEIIKGPPGDIPRDDGARHAVAMRVLHRLECDSCARVREWRTRQQCARDHSRWGPLLSWSRCAKRTRISTTVPAMWLCSSGEQPKVERGNDDAIARPRIIAVQPGNASGEFGGCGQCGLGNARLRDNCDVVSFDGTSGELMLPNKEWPAIISRLLRGTDAERNAARAIVWLEVDDYVVHVARLPMGPLADDEDDRRNVSLRVLRTLERRDYAHIREWERRSHQRRDAAEWWGFIKVVTRCRAIEYARSSRRNLAPRGQPFVWAEVEVTAPAAFAEPMPSTAQFVLHASAAELYEFLERVNRARTVAARGTEPPAPPPATTGPSIRRRGPT